MYINDFILLLSIDISSTVSLNCASALTAFQIERQLANIWSRVELDFAKDNDTSNYLWQCGNNTIAKNFISNKTRSQFDVLSVYNP